MPIVKLDVNGRAVWVRQDGDGAPQGAREGHASLAALLADGAERAAVDGAGAGAGDGVGNEAGDGAGTGAGRRLAPLEDGARIVCIGLNYRAHAEESGHDVPRYPVVFYRTPESLVGNGEPMILPAVSDRFDWEGELGVVIGTGGHRIGAAQAMDHVAGYCCVNDGSLRDWQKHTSQFSPGKNFDRSGAIGPVIATVEEVGAPEQLTLTTRLNGDVMQHSGLDDLIFPIPELIAYVSAYMALRPGDVIATGTPAGVGGARTPPRFLRAGDEIEVEISRVGLLANPIRAEGQAG